jgi:hypothetical protein
MFLKKKENKIRDEIFDFFKVEKTDGDLTALGDFKDKDFSAWLTFIHDVIQRALKTKIINTKNIENYVNITMYMAGQRVDIAIIKDGQKGPHELLEELKNAR